MVGVAVEFESVLGHIGVEQNWKTDESAKAAKESRGMRGYPKQFTSLAHIERRFTESRWMEVKLRVAPTYNKPSTT